MWLALSSIVWYRNRVQRSGLMADRQLKPGTDAGLPACTLRGPNGRLHSRRTLPRRVSTIDCDGLGPLAALGVLRQLVPRPRHVEQQRPVFG